MESDSRSGDDYEREVRALLDHAVHDEVAVALGIQGKDAPAVILDSVANAVISRIDHGFRFRWDPEWVKDGRHQWAEWGRFYARCTACFEVSPGEADAESAGAWYRRHAVECHAG